MELRAFKRPGTNTAGESSQNKQTKKNKKQQKTNKQKKLLLKWYRSWKTHSLGRHFMGESEIEVRWSLGDDNHLHGHWC